MMVSKINTLPEAPSTRTTARMMLSVMCVVLAVTGDVGTVNAGSPNWSDLAWNANGTLLAGFGFQLDVLNGALETIVESDNLYPDTRYDDLQWHPKDDRFVVIERVPIAETNRTQQFITILDAVTLDVITRNALLIEEAMLARSLGWLTNDQIMVEVLLEDTQRIYTLNTETLEVIHSVDVAVNISDVLNIGHGFFSYEDRPALLSVVYCHDCAEEGVRQRLHAVDGITGEILRDVVLPPMMSASQFDINTHGQVAMTTEDSLIIYDLLRDIELPVLIAPLRARFTSDDTISTLDRTLSLRWNPQSTMITLAISNGFNATTPAWAVIVYDAITGEQVQTVSQGVFDPDSVYTVAWHPNGERVVTVNWSNIMTDYSLMLENNAQ